MRPTLDVIRGYPLRALVSLFQDAAATVPVDLTGCICTGAIGRALEGGALVTLTVTLTDAANGEMLVEADAESTELLTGSAYHWDLCIADSEGFPQALPMGGVAVAGVQTPIPTP
jgi:hypothetical protein